MASPCEVRLNAKIFRISEWEESFSGQNHAPLCHISDFRKRADMQDN